MTRPSRTSRTTTTPSPRCSARTAPRDLTFTYPDGTFDSDKSIADTGTALETAFVGAYMGAIPALKDNGLKKVAAQIGANEAQHLTTLKSLGRRRRRSSRTRRSRRL